LVSGVIWYFGIQIFGILVLPSCTIVNLHNLRTCILLKEKRREGRGEGKQKHLPARETCSWRRKRGLELVIQARKRRGIQKSFSCQRDILFSCKRVKELCFAQIKGLIDLHNKRIWSKKKGMHHFTSPPCLQQLSIIINLFH
jgi:hypothetical protein